MTIEAAHPKSPGMRCARTYFLANAANAAAAANGFTEAGGLEDNCSPRYVCS
jgi:hypothetical protein